MGIIGAIIWFSVQPDMYGGKTIPLEYVLKAPKEKILNYKEVDGIIQYLYVSDVEVLTADFKGLKEDITQRTANTQFFKTGKTKNGQEEYVAKVYGGNPFYNDKGKWYQTETAFTTVEAFNSQTKVSFFKKLLGKALADIFYSGTGDGRITYLTTDLTWATAHNASAGTGLAYVNAEVIGPGTGKTAAGQFRMSRNFFPFNTSALPDNAVISAASFNIYVTSRKWQ